MAKRIFTLVSRIRELASQQGGYSSTPEIVNVLATASQQAFNALLPAKAARPVGPGLNREVDARLAPFLTRKDYTSAPIELPADCAYVDYYDVPGAVTVEEVSGSALLYRLADPNCGPTEKYPIVGNRPGQRKQLYPETLSQATVQYYARPTEPVYKEDYSSGAAVYDDNNSVDTGWQPDMEPELLVRCLRLLGLEIRDPALMQVAAQLTSEAL